MLIKDSGNQATPRPSSAMVFNKNALGAVNTTEIVLPDLVCALSEYKCRSVVLRIRPRPDASLYSRTAAPEA